MCNHTFRVLVHNDVSKETIARDKPYTFDGSMNDIMDYFLDVCAMFRVDMDSNPPNSIDVMVPGYPIISVLIKNKEHPFPEGLVRRVLRSWMTRELHKVAQ